MTEPLSYAEVDSDGGVLHVCSVYRAEGRAPRLATVAKPAVEQGRFLKAIGPDDDVTPGQTRVEADQFVPAEQ